MRDEKAVECWPKAKFGRLRLFGSRLIIFFPNDVLTCYNSNELNPSVECRVVDAELVFFKSTQ